MAKYGEGDKRWIVEERPDGTNVHNWHWSERDCLAWSRSLLSSLLQGLNLLDGEGGLSARSRFLDKLDGEAYVNVRKGKVIPGYELSLTLSWDGEASDPAADRSTNPPVKVRGTIEVPYLADENSGEDPELRVTVRGDDGPLRKRVREALLAKGRPLVLEKIREYVRAMAQGGPAKDELEAKRPKSLQQKASFDAAGATPETKGTKEEEKRREGFKTITLTERFNCRARDVYEILMDEGRWKGFTQSNARISREVGGEFSLFDGSVTGTIVELQDAKVIVQRWRFSSWADGIHSTVRLEFDEPEQGLTIIKLTQTDVPVEDRYGNSTVVENTERGWRDLIFHNIRAAFGFGI